MNTAPRLLVLDFDGVIADGMAECVLVSWLGACPPPAAVPVSSCLPQVPDAFRQRFTTIRGYARVLEHFLVAHHPAAASIGSRAGFEDLYATIPAAEAASFAQAAASVRQRCRTEEPAFWAGLHTLYPGLAQTLRNGAGPVTVLTAKDEPSVRDILAHHGLAAAVTEVTGDCSGKADAITSLCSLHQITPQQVTFIDDNLANVTAAAAAGVEAYWALWGYHAPGDRAAASRAGIRCLSLAALPALTSAPPGMTPRAAAPAHPNPER